MTEVEMFYLLKDMHCISLIYKPFHIYVEGSVLFSYGSNLAMYNLGLFTCSRLPFPTSW